MEIINPRHNLVNGGERECSACKKVKSVDCFFLYSYTTNQNKRSKRYGSHCKECKKIERRIRVSKNPGKYSSVSKRWRIRNKQYLSKYSREYRCSDRGRAARAESQRIREYKIKKSSLSKEDKIKISNIYIDCQIISKKTGILHHVDHIIPLSRGGEHLPANLQILPAVENLKKGNKI